MNGTKTPLFVATDTGSDCRLFFPESVLLASCEANSRKKALEYGRLIASKLGSPPIELEAAAEDSCSLVVCLTTRCNLRCQYCYIHGRDKDWPWEKQVGNGMDLTKVCREIGHHLERKVTQLHITFFGGEPLLAKPILMKITQVAQKMAAKAEIPVKFSLTTNGVLLDEKFLEWALRNRFEILVSLDSPPDLHDRYRGAGQEAHSFARILSNLSGFESDLSVVTTITHQTLSFRSALEPLLEHGFKSVSFNLVHTQDPELRLSKSDVERFTSEWREATAWFGSNRDGIGNLSRLLELLRSRKLKVSPCSAGGGSYAITSSGKRYFCHGCVGNPECELGEKREPTSKWLRERWSGSSLPPRCRDCWARYLCGGECWLVRWHLSTEDKAIRCNLIRDYSELALRVFDPADMKSDPQ